jgi:hypothetical protein
MAGSRTLKLNILAETKDLVDGLNKANGQVGAAGSKMGDTFKKVGLAVAAAGAAVGAFAIKFGVQAVQAASDLNETISKSQQIFGSAASEIEKFAAGAASSLGQSKQQALDAAATFGIFGKSAGLAGADLAKFSTDFVTLAGDLASFNNTTPEEAITAIGSALRGEAEPLRRFGVLLDDATLRQAALELGIVSTTKNALTPQQKVLAAQAVIYKQTGDAQGDFARTSEGLANQQRILTAQIENVKTSIGTALLPVATELFSFVGSKLIPIITKFSDSFSENASPAIDDMRRIVADFVLPALKNLYYFITEFVIPTIGNVLEPVIRVLQAAFVFLSQKIKENEDAFRTAAAIMLNIFAFVRDNLAPVLGNVLATAFNIITRAIGLAIDNFGRVFAIIEKVAKFLGFDLDLALGETTKKINKNTEATADAYREFQRFNKENKDETLPGITNLDTGFNNMAKSSVAAANGIRSLTSAQREANALKKEVAALQAGGALPATISADLKRFYRSELGLISQHGGFIEGINRLPTDPFFGFGQGGNVGLAIQQRQSGSAAATGGTIINITGTVLDPEGTARAIQSVIQNSSARAGDLPFVPTGLAFE